MTVQISRPAAGMDLDLEEIYRSKNKEVKSRCTTDKKQWYESKAGEAKEAATRGDHRTLNTIVKVLTGRRMQSQQNKDDRWQIC